LVSSTVVHFLFLNYWAETASQQKSEKTHSEIGKASILKPMFVEATVLVGSRDICSKEIWPTAQFITCHKGKCLKYI